MQHSFRSLQCVPLVVMLPEEGYVTTSSPIPYLIFILIAVSSSFLCPYDCHPRTSRWRPNCHRGISSTNTVHFGSSACGKSRFVPHYWRRSGTGILFPNCLIPTRLYTGNSGDGVRRGRSRLRHYRRSWKQVYLLCIPCIRLTLCIGG